MKLGLIWFLSLTQAVAKMPHWLSYKSGLSAWPGDGIPSYVWEPHHNTTGIPDIPRRGFGECPDDLTGCSFDCYQCLSTADITSCDRLSQTFDDGPSRYTPALLDALSRSRTKTTFFVIGKNVITYPEHVRRERREGHVVAVHTWSHQFLPALSNEQVFAELQWCIWAINATSGVLPRYFRPPYGGVDDRIRAIATQLGLQIVLWDRDTGDWQINIGERDSSRVIQDVDAWLQCNAGKRWQKPTGLILEHDLYPANIKLANQIRQKIKFKQKTVAQCAKQPKYHDHP